MDAKKVNLESVGQENLTVGGFDQEKSAYYNRLMKMPEGIRMYLLISINEQYGYEFLNEYEFNRYVIFVQNKHNNMLNTKIKFEESITPTGQIAKEMQVGYMKMLSSYLG